jgi:hypothetical protein
MGNFTFSHFGLAPVSSALPRVPIGKLLSRMVSISKFFAVQR